MSYVIDDSKQGLGSKIVRDPVLLKCLYDEIFRAVNVENFTVNKTFTIKDGDSKFI